MLRLRVQVSPGTPTSSGLSHFPQSATGAPVRSVGGAALGEPRCRRWASLADVAVVSQRQGDEAAERTQEGQVGVLVGGPKLRTGAEQARDRPLAARAVAADEQVGAAQGRAALWAGGELSPGAFGERPQARGGHPLPLPGEGKRGFGLGKPGPRSLELAGGRGERTFPLACALLLASIEPPRKERHGGGRQAEAVFPGAGGKRLLERVRNASVENRAHCK